MTANSYGVFTIYQTLGVKCLPVYYRMLNGKSVSLTSDWGLTGSEQQMPDRCPAPWRKVLNHQLRNQKPECRICLETEKPVLPPLAIDCPLSQWKTGIKAAKAQCVWGGGVSSAPVLREGRITLPSPLGKWEGPQESSRRAWVNPLELQTVVGEGGTPTDCCTRMSECPLIQVSLGGSLPKSL